MRKGGIYNHFASKDELALEAFDYASNCVSRRFDRGMIGKSSAVDQLLTFGEVFQGNHKNPTVEGGCPLLNTAIDSDDAHPELKARVKAAFDRWRSRIVEIIRAGVESGELRPETDAEAEASCMISILEGGSMMSRLYGDPVHLDRAVRMLASHVRKELVA